MRRLVITETDAGQFICETSDGVRTTGATLASAIDKLTVTPSLPHDLFAAFARITDKRGAGQIVTGQAGA